MSVLNEERQTRPPADVVLARNVDDYTRGLDSLYCASKNSAKDVSKEAYGNVFGLMSDGAEELTALAYKAKNEEFSFDLPPFEVAEGAAIAHQQDIAEDSNSDSDDLDAEYHSLCFVPHNGCIYELDGLRNQPIKHEALKATSTPSSSQEWAVQAGQIIQKRFLDKYVTDQFVTFAVGIANKGVKRETKG